MKQLQDILYGVSLQAVHGTTQRQVSTIELDSRKLKDDSLFVAIAGVQQDGHQYIETAIDQGATVIVCEKLPATPQKNITYIQVKETRKAVAVIAANFYEHPSKDLKLIGVTGTNGKTTIATLGHQLLTGLGVKTGLLSTIENKIGQDTEASTLTTPDSITVNRLLRKMADAGCSAVFMEVSSHAVVQQRVSGLTFSGGVFTNISRDHLDYHKTFKEYIRAKQQFFDGLPKSAFALYNEDDKNGEVMVQNTAARRISYGLKSLSDYKVKILENTLDGLLLTIDGLDFYSRLAGDFNALNLLAVYATAEQLGYEPMNILEVLSSLQGASGRLEKVVSSNKIIGIIDYAHTPDALEKVLKTLNQTRTGLEELITVIGCGGDRDKGKRPLMGKVAAELSTKVILTSDNPRNETPSEIIDDMKQGVPVTKKKNVNSITDRKEAIQTAVSMATAGDIILVAGKGHEDYQEIKGKRYPFDDKVILKEAFTEFAENNNN